MKKTGILGGTFDPIHHGHLITAQAIKEIRNLEKLIFIPARISPFKQNESASRHEHRLEMLHLATDEIKWFDISSIELKKDQVSYTINTVKELKNKYDEIELIIGYDHFLNFDKWKDPEKLVELSTLVVMRRKTEEILPIKNNYFNSAVFVESPIIEISGTDIRRRVRENLPIDFLVPKSVKEYIYNQKLYKE